MQPENLAPGERSPGGPGTSPDSPPTPTAEMKALAQIASGIAPALNDLLTVITGRAGLLLDAAATSAPMHESLNQIYTAGERASSLIRQLMLFSGREKPRMQVIDLNGLIEETGGVLRRLLGTGISVEFQLTPRLPFVSADAGMLEQTILGFGLNALDAMPQGGKFAIATTAVTLTETDAEKNSCARPGPFVVFSVADTGGGIAPEILPRIFEPFFTTKSAGRSAGLGLAAIFGIVQQHHGWVTVESKVGAGTTLNVFLPAAPAGLPAAPVPQPITQSGGGRETILLVEDDVALREFTVAVLQHYGYRVLQAGNGTDALEAWKWHHTRIALLLTDMVLDDNMTGLDLAIKLRTEKPGLPLICTSGHDREIMTRSSAPPDGCHFLQKPCRPQELARAVRASLDQKTA